jgi:hypothetical protein
MSATFHACDLNRGLALPGDKLTPRLLRRELADIQPCSGYPTWDKPTPCAPVSSNLAAAGTLDAVRWLLPMSATASDGEGFAALLGG